MWAQKEGKMAAEEEVTKVDKSLSSGLMNMLQPSIEALDMKVNNVR